jgi:hypothetical protein
MPSKPLLALTLPLLLPLPPAPRLLLKDSALLETLEQETEDVKFEKDATSWRRLMSLVMQLRKVRGRRAQASVCGAAALLGCMPCKAAAVWAHACGAWLKCAGYLPLYRRSVRCSSRHPSSDSCVRA